MTSALFGGFSKPDLFQRILDDGLFGAFCLEIGTRHRIGMRLRLGHGLHDIAVFYIAKGHEGRRDGHEKRFTGN